MSNSRVRFHLKEAAAHANEVVTALKPYCIKIEPAGSIRRKKEDVGDIEIVCLPERQGLILNGQIQLFEAVPIQQQPLPEFVKIVNQWPSVKGDPRGKYTQRILPCGIKLDLFIANPDNWGLILAMRTGSSHFSMVNLACTWSAMGYEAANGVLYKDGKKFVFPEEQDLFELLHISWIEPELRI